MFTAYAFTALYIAGKLGVFSVKGRGQSPRLVVAMAPLLVAVLVGISRLRDRRHHPEGEASTAYSLWRERFHCWELCFSVVSM